MKEVKLMAVKTGSHSADGPEERAYILEAVLGAARRVDRIPDSVLGVEILRVLGELVGGGELENIE